MKKFLAILGSALMGLMLATAAYATVEQVPVEVTWIAPISVASTQAMQFGLLDVNTVAAETVTILTDNTYTESTPDTVIGGTQLSAVLTITVANLTNISIIADNHLGATYYTLDTWMCNYEGAGATACDVAYDLQSSATSISGDTLVMGATLHALASITAITDDSTYDVTVTYQ